MRAQLIVTTCMWTTVVLGEDTRFIPGNMLIESCRDILGTSQEELFKQGMCSGIVYAIGACGNQLVVKNCAPGTVTIKQSIRVLVAFMDKHPERLHEPIGNLAMFAFGEAWPCK